MIRTSALTSKLVMRFRSPSPALIFSRRSAPHNRLLRSPLVEDSWDSVLVVCRSLLAVPVDRHGRAPGLGVDPAHARGDLLVAGGVEVDQGGAGAGVPHSLHQLAG